MAGQSPDVEILVHVAAPCRAADDVLYRQLAQAYLSFRPERRVVLPPVRDTPEGTGDDASAKIREEAPLGSSDQGLAAAAAEQVFGPDSQDLSFRSAFDNRSSPLLPPANRRSPRGMVPPSSQTSDAPAQSFCAPASQISDSYPLPDSGVMRATPTRILQRYLKHPGVSVSSSPSPSPLRGREARRREAEADAADVPSSLPIPGHGQEPGQSHYLPDAGKVIPVTPVVPQTLTRKRKGLVEVEAQAAFDITHVSSSLVSHAPTSSPSRAESEPLPWKKPKTRHDIDASSLVRSSSDAGPIRSSNVSAIEHIAHTLEIRPPSPPVGMAHIDPASLVSEEFAKLARDLAARYRPRESRPLGPFERGYWLVDCTRWSPPTRLDAWVFLTNYLRSGLAGWGVWCRRDAAHDRIRLYGWGCVAKNTYLLLYLASGRQVKTTGARWFDADGDVALEVPPSERRA